MTVDNEFEGSGRPSGDRSEARSKEVKKKKQGGSTPLTPPANRTLNIINKPTLSTFGPLGSGRLPETPGMPHASLFGDTTQCSTYINLSPTEFQIRIIIIVDMDASLNKRILSEFQIKLSSRSCRSLCSTVA